MKHVLTAAVFGITLAACQTTTDSAVSTAQFAPGQIATQGDINQIAGKRLIFNNNPEAYVVIHTDGRLSGTWQGVALKGTYEMRDGYVCRVITSGPRGAQPEDCQLMIRDGNTLHITRDRGNGQMFTYSIA